MVLEDVDFKVIEKRPLTPDEAAMTYLVDQGVAARRITMISYGKERAQCTDHHEACWAKNRRAHFLVKRG